VAQPAQQVQNAPTAQAAPAPQTTTLGAQLARPVFTLAAAGRGEHVMTVHVTPEQLGPVTVRAHVGAEGVRVELFAPTDAGRDALRAILPDLRRDFSGSGLSGSLDLSSQNQPGPQQDAQQRRPSLPEPVEPGQRGRDARAAAVAVSTATAPAAAAAGGSIDLIV
jgi:flagellar hook-length control protein FliK